MLFSNFDYIDGVLSRNGVTINNFLWLLITGLILTIIPTVYSVYLFIKFKKTEGVKFLNKPWFLTVILSQFFTIITISLGWMFFYGEFILGTGAEAGRIGFSIVLTSIILTFTITVIWYLILLFFSQNIWILIETNTKTISTISMAFKIEKIVKVIKDEQKRKVYINYIESRTNLKKISFSTASTMGAFILENIDKLETELSVESQEEFAKNKVIELKAVNVDNSKTTSQKQAVKNDKPADYYEILGVSKSATDDEIKKAYKKLAKQYQGELNKSDPDASKKLKELTKAAEALLGEKKPAKETKNKEEA